MKSIISVNHKFMSYTPHDLVELIINNSKYCNGIELFVDYHNPSEIEYMKQIAFELNKNNMIFQLHGNSRLDINDQIDFIHIVENLYDLLGYKINIVMHPLDDLESTIEYLNTLTSNVNNDKVIISLENLNSLHDEYRLHKEEIVPIIANNEKIFMTYDIGHEMIENGGITNLNEHIIPLISNVHIHTHDNIYDDGFDHKPIFPNDHYWLDILKGIEFLKLNKYERTIVYEYDVYMCHGETLEDQIKSYLESIDFVSDYYM